MQKLLCEDWKVKLFYFILKIMFFNIYIHVFSIAFSCDMYVYCFRGNNKQCRWCDKENYFWTKEQCLRMQVFPLLWYSLAWTLSFEDGQNMNSICLFDCSKHLSFYLFWLISASIFRVHCNRLGKLYLFIVTVMVVHDIR